MVTEIISTHSLSFGVILGLLALLWLLGWAVVDTFWPNVPQHWYRAGRQRHRFSLDAVERLKDLHSYLQQGLDQDDWAHRTELLITFSLHLGKIGRLLTREAELQVERFTGRALLQIADDAQNMSARSERFTQLAWHMGSLIHAIEIQNITDLFDALALMFHVVHMKEDATLVSPRVAPALYPHFKEDLTRYLSRPVDNAAFVGFLQRWRKLSLANDTYLFLLIRVLDAFRRPFFQIQSAGDADQPHVARLKRFVSAYLDGLEQGDRVAQYRALSLLITELQLATEIEDANQYVVRIHSHERAMVGALDGTPWPTRLPELQPLDMPGTLSRLEPASG